MTTARRAKLARSEVLGLVSSESSRTTGIGGGATRDATVRRPHAITSESGGSPNCGMTNQRQRTISTSARLTMLTIHPAAVIQTTETKAAVKVTAFSLVSM